MSLIKGLKSLLVVIPSVIIFFLGMTVFPKNAALHGVFPHPSLATLLLLFQFISWYEVILLGISLAIGHVISLNLFIDFEQVVSIRTYEYMALPAFIIILSLVFAIFRYFRQKDENVLKNNLEQEKKRISHFEIENRELSKANNDLKVKLAMSNQGVPQILESMINFWKDSSHSVEFEQVVSPLIGKGKLQIEMPNGAKTLIATQIPFVQDEVVQKIWNSAWDLSRSGAWNKTEESKAGAPVLYRVFFRKNVPEGIIFWSGMSSYDLKNGEIYWESIWDLWRIKNEDKIGQALLDNNLVLDFENNKFRPIFNFYRIVGGHSLPLEKEQVWRITKVFLEKDNFKKVTLFKTRKSQSIYWGILPEEEKDFVQQINNTYVFKRLNYSLQAVED